MWWTIQAFSFALLSLHSVELSYDWPHHTILIMSNACFWHFNGGELRWKVECRASGACWQSIRLWIEVNEFQKFLSDWCLCRIGRSALIPMLFMWESNFNNCFQIYSHPPLAKGCCDWIRHDNVFTHMLLALWRRPCSYQQWDFVDTDALFLNLPSKPISTRSKAGTCATQITSRTIKQIWSQPLILSHDVSVVTFIWHCTPALKYF